MNPRHAKMLSELAAYKAIWHKTSEAMQKKYGIHPREIEPYLMGNKKFNEWFMRSFKPSSPTFQELVIKQNRIISKMSIEEILDKRVDSSEGMLESSFSSDSDYTSDESSQQIIALSRPSENKKMKKRR